MLFQSFDLKNRNPYLSLAIDEGLALLMARNDKLFDFTGGLRIWSNPYTIVLGRTCQWSENIVMPPHFLHKNKVYIARRISGGGTVLHGAGNINYSIFLSLKKFPEFFSLQKSYEILLKKICLALEDQNIFAKPLGLSDLAICKEGNFYKISGNAQFRRRNFLVLHGTLIIQNSLIEKISSYLKHPPKEPDYRFLRSHKNFMTSLGQSFQWERFAKKLRGLLEEMAGESEASQNLNIEQKKELYKLVHRLCQRFYKKEEWIQKGQNTRKKEQEKKAWELKPSSFAQAKK